MLKSRYSKYLKELLNMGEIKIGISEPEDEAYIAIKLIEKLMKKNNIDFKLNILYDYNLEECGVYYLHESQKNNIFVNPKNCGENSEEAKDLVYWHGYLKDVSLFGVIIHEFCHFLQYRVYKSIIEDYIKEFPTERFYINDYANNEIRDEIAEVMTVYITNPYLLKLVSEKHWKFMKNHFKSPVACNLESCFRIYNSFPIKVKEDLKNRWKIIFNMDTEKFEKVDEKEIEVVYKKKKNAK